MERSLYCTSCVCVCVYVLCMLDCFSHVWLCYPKDCSLPDSSVHGILQARILEGLPCPSPGDLPNPGIELMPPASNTLKANSLSTETPEKPKLIYRFNVIPIQKKISASPLRRLAKLLMSLQSESEDRTGLSKWQALLIWNYLMTLSYIGKSISRRDLLLADHAFFYRYHWRCYAHVCFSILFFSCMAANLPSDWHVDPFQIWMLCSTNLGCKQSHIEFQLIIQLIAPDPNLISRVSFFQDFTSSCC